MESSGEQLAFVCPRCHHDVEAGFYGPCEACRAALRATVRGAAHTIETDYEPKMNVTPNAVALKDD